MTKKKKTGTNQSKENASPAPYKLPYRKKAKCPACFATIVWEQDKESDKGWTPCDPQLRIVVFDIPENDLTAVDHDQLVKGIEVSTGKCIFGRAVNEQEEKYYKQHRTLNGIVPWAMARASHFETCTRWDLWLNGTAKYPAPTTECGDGGDIHAIVGGSLETND